MRNKKLIGFIAGILAAVTLIAGSMAYFTDRAIGATQGTIGDMRVELTDLNMDTSSPAVPGGVMPLTYTVANVGTLALDEREKVSLAVYQKDTGEPAALTADEFSIYETDDVELTEDGYRPKENAQPIGAVIADMGDNTIAYQLDQTVMSGSEETVGGEADTLTRDFVILLNREITNDFQNISLMLNVYVEAKQNAYTGSDWTQMQSETIEFNAKNIPAVPSAERDK